MQNILLKFFVVFLCTFSSAHTSDGYFVHRDQFYSCASEEKEAFHPRLQKANERQASTVRNFKIENREEPRNIILCSFFSFYDEKHIKVDVREMEKVFLSGWLPVEAGKIKTFFEKEPFCLGSAYKSYPLFNKSTEILSLKKHQVNLFLR